VHNNRAGGIQNRAHDPAPDLRLLAAATKRVQGKSFIMKRLICLSTLLALAPVREALALGDLADVTIIDRDSGVTLTPYVHRGEYWIAGRPGAHYGIQIRNATGGRLLAVMSVDGINVLTGDTAAWHQRGYVLNPQVSYTVTGWRKSRDEVATFVFTAQRNSYAALTERPEHVGVIGVALFRERGARIGESRHEPAPERLSADADVDLEKDQKRARLGTGHGEREISLSTLTSFERQEREPGEVITIRYDSMPRLIAMGIVPPPGAGRDAPDAFPGSQLPYVPDPPRR
jgi:hypothetical protein